jgi:hypothetical protein
MVAMLILFVFGAAAGAGTGSPLAALGGGLVGLMLGLAVYAVGRIRDRAPADGVIETHAAMCFPYAQPAELEVLGDPERGRWVDVTWCSLHKEMHCDKGCLRLLNVTSVRPPPAAAPI